MNKLFVIFLLLSVVNVILQTVKSLVTVKCGKLSAAVMNAVAYGIYTVLLVYMNCDLDTATKALVTAGCNFIGVYIVKYFEEKARKDKIWKIECSVKCADADAVAAELEKLNLSFNNVSFGERKTFNIYANTQAETTRAREVIKKYNAKYFISETKSF